MLERREASLPDLALTLFASLKRRTISVALGTLEDENYQAAVTPSEAEGSKALRPPIVVRHTSDNQKALVIWVGTG